MTHIPDLKAHFAYALFYRVHSWSQKAWYMSIFLGVFYPNGARHSPGAFVRLLLSARLLARWLKRARGLNLLPGRRHRIASGWFMTSVAHRHSCCKTPLPSASVFFCISVYFIWHWPQTTGLFFPTPQAAQLSLAEFALHSPLTAFASHWLPLCVTSFHVRLRSPALINSALPHQRLLACQFPHQLL